MHLSLIPRHAGEIGKGMNIMKKLIALLLVLVMAMTLVACGQTAGNETADQGNNGGTTGENLGVETTEDPVNVGEDEPDFSDLGYVLSEGKLIVGITEYEPMDYKDENGEWTGFDAELARLFAEELGVDCEFFVLGDWGKKFFELDATHIDCVWNGMTITDEAKNNASVSDPYVINAQVVVMKKDDISKYPDVASMKDLVFAVEEGSAGQKEAANNNLKTVAKQDQAGALMEVAAGTADGCIIDITMANAMTGEGTDYANLTGGLKLSTEEYGVAFRKGSDITAKFNAFLKELKDDGTLENLAKKYNLTLA